MNGLLNAYLSAYAALTALVGQRIYGAQAAQGTSKPYVVHYVISDIPEHTLAGPNGLRKVYFQVSCFGSTQASAQAVENQVVAALKAWSASESEVQAVLIEDRRDIPETESRDEVVTDLYHRAVDALILYVEEE